MEPTTQYEQVEPAEAAPPDGWRMRAVGALVLVAGLVLWLAPSQQTDAPGPRARPGSASAVSLPAAELSVLKRGIFSLSHARNISSGGIWFSAIIIAGGLAANNSALRYFRLLVSKSLKYLTSGAPKT